MRWRTIRSTLPGAGLALALAALPAFSANTPPGGSRRRARAGGPRGRAIPVPAVRPPRPARRHRAPRRKGRLVAPRQRRRHDVLVSGELREARLCDRGRALVRGRRDARRTASMNMSGRCSGFRTTSRPASSWTRSPARRTGRPRARTTTPGSRGGSTPRTCWPGTTSWPARNSSTRPTRRIPARSRPGSRRSRASATAGTR